MSTKEIKEAEQTQVIILNANLSQFKGIYNYNICGKGNVTSKGVGTLCNESVL